MRLLTLPFLFSFTLFAAETAKSGIEPSGFDTTCKPCDDFWRFVNGTFLDKNPIPARYPNWGVMSMVNEANKERSRTILEAARSNTKAAAGSDTRKMGDLYGSCMDEAAINARGIQPLKPELDRVAAVKSVKDLVALLVALQRTLPFQGPIGIVGAPDAKNSKVVVAYVGNGGLSLPDRDYYMKDDDRSVEIRKQFVQHVTKMFELMGESPSAASDAAKTILKLETSFADASMTNVMRRDPYARYNKMDLEGLSKLAPMFDWKSLLTSLKISEKETLIVSEPKFISLFEKQLNEFPLEGWKTWLRWRLLSNGASELSKPFADEDFHFNKTILTGAKEQLPRWQICSNIVDSQLGDSLGKAFTEKHFPPAAKKRMLELVENMRASLSEELQSADWLATETRKNALAKLNAFKAKIGYPDRWRDYSTISISPKSYYENVQATVLGQRLYQLAKIGKPVDRNDWGMTPPTVNAYYNPLQNEIAFPAGILQPPMFDMSADDAANYGAIGAVIGHEMGHGFDDQGSKFDAEGNLKNWWTPEDRAKFEQKAACVIDQFNTIEVGEGLHHTGKLVVGEALGDLGGLKLAYHAYHRTLRGKPAPPVLDGYTADQRFFIAFAHTWGNQYRAEAMRLRLNTDPHPLAKFRANGTLSNMPEFQKAFSCKQGDAMVRPANKQCKLW